MSKNSKKDAFLKRLATKPVAGGASDSNIHKLLRLNLKFFTHDQQHSSGFDDLTHEELKKLINKLVNFSDKSLLEWSNETAGGHKLYVNYRKFPSNTEFKHPACVPHDVEWCRFRIGSKLRLIGFVIPDNLHGTTKDDFHYDRNAFYLVFIDKEHKFYITEPR